MKKKINKKDLIKNIAIVLLIVLLILTFFSNSIMNASLPEVSAQYPKYASLSTTVKLTGTVRANENFNVVYEPDSDEELVQTRRVVAVYVKEGDTVYEGTVLFMVAGGYSEQLKNAMQELESLQNQYDLSLIDDNIDYLTRQQTISRSLQEIQDAKDTLQKLRETYQTALNGGDAAEALKGELEVLKENLKNVNSNLEFLATKTAEAEATVSSAESILRENKLDISEIPRRLAALKSEYEIAEAEYEQLTSEIDRLSADVEDMSEEIADMTEAAGITTVIAALNEQIVSLQKQIAESQDLDEIVALYAQIDTVSSDLAEQYTKLKIIGQETVDELTLYAFNRQLSEMQKDLSKKRDQLAATSEYYNTTKSELETLQSVYDAVNGYEEYKALLENYRAQTAEQEKKRDDLEQKIADTTAKIQNNEALDPESIAESIKNQEESLQSLETQYQITLAQYNRSGISTDQERENQKKKIEELKATIEKYRNAPTTTEVTSPTSGRIASISVVPGSYVSNGDSVASIELTDRGYKCEISVAAEEARRIYVGAKVTVSNSWWYSNVEANVTNIRSDPSTQGKQRIVTITCSGDVYEGQSLTFIVGDSSEYYSTVLPNSAIRNDNDGQFVLVVESKDTPLGTRYTAKRVEVSILASDDTQSAVSGLQGGEFVITNATSPISDNQQVRLADEK